MQHVFEHVLAVYFTADRVVTVNAVAAFVQGRLQVANLDHLARMEETPAVVCKAWHAEARRLMRKELEALRAAFFEAALASVMPTCLDCAACGDVVCILRMDSARTRCVSHTVLELRVTADAMLTSGEDYDADLHAACVSVVLNHFPVDDCGQEIRQVAPWPAGKRHGDWTLVSRAWRLHGRPDYYLLDRDRTEAQRAEATAWLAELRRDMLAWTWTEFRRMNGRAWWRERYANAAGAARFEVV